ncbi:reverse transcriptase domain-containing protein [Tanacetum coccineum]
MTSNHSFNPKGINPKAQDVVKDEIVKLLDFGLIYPISDSLWVSPIHVVPKKGGMTLVLNDNNELIPSRTVTGWRVCIDYRKLSDATRKDHFPLLFIDQMLERLSGNEYYYFLGGFLRLFQILIAPIDQEKTTFPCPYGTFAYKRMSFGLCNAPATFQRCMTAIFHDMVKDFMEVFMDDFLVFGSSFNCCLDNLDKMLASKQDAKPRLIRWIMLLQGFDIEIKDKKGAENLAANHLSRLKKPDLGVFTKAEIADEFPDEHLMILKAKLNDDEPCVFKDAKDYVIKCDACQRSGNISSRSEMPQNNIQVCDVFNIWGLDFMGLFPNLRGNRYILVDVDYVSKWVEAQALPMNDVRVVVKFLRGLFARRILESSVGYNPKDWFEKLNDALWAFRTAYKMPTRCTPFRLVYDKACYLPLEIEHKAYWALKQGNMKLRDGAYENTRISKERTKKWHDSRLRGDKYFKVGYKVLLFNSRLRMHPGKLKSKWYGPNVVKTVYRMGQWKSPIKMKLVIRSMEKDLRSTTMDILIGNIKRSSNSKKIRHKA